MAARSFPLGADRSRSQVCPRGAHMTTDPRNSDRLPTAEGTCRPLGRHVVLIGLRASGKSTVAAALADALTVDWVDLDERTRVILGSSTVREAFLQHGEAACRAAESEALSAALDGPPAVLALGGGTPTAPGAAYRLDAERRGGRAFVVFLDPDIAVLAARLRSHDGDRPSLTGRGVVEEIEEIARARRPLYAALADLRLLDDLDAASAVSIITSQVC